MVRVRKIVAVAAAALVGVTAVGGHADAADPYPPFIMPDAKWLTTVNYYRSMAKLAPVTENTTLSQGAYNHSCYMLENGITHDEIPGYPGYTTSGDNAGNKGNVAVSSIYESTSRYFVELWMTGPFHAIGVLRHNLKTVGWGRCASTTTSPWKSAATLNIIDGLDYSAPEPTAPILFPGNGTTTNLSRFVTESPNPMSMCGWTGTAGLPILALMPEAVTSASTTLSGPNGAISTCRLFGGNTSGVASNILKSENAVVVMPRTELTAGKYTVTVTTNARKVAWSFTVDPTAATGIMPPPTATKAGPTSQFTPMQPFRYADSRVPFRITKVLAGTVKKIQVAGVAGIPSDATAISANVIVVSPAASGRLLVYNCSSSRPTANTMHFGLGETVVNAIVAPLGSGSMCVYAPVDTHLIIDINGYFRATSASRYTPIDPIPVLDTATGLGASGRRQGSTVTTVQVRGSDSALPDTASGAVLSITTHNAAANGVVTVYSCDTVRPPVGTLRAVVGGTRQNLVIAPISAAGSVCVHTSSTTDLRVDVVGYLAASSGSSFVPTTSTRLIDTTDRYRPLMNFDLGGARLPANTVKSVALAGQRGISASAKAVSINVTVVPSTVAGTITVQACNSTSDSASITFAASKATAMAMQVRIPATGDLCVRSTASTHVAIDLTGYWV